MFCEKDVLKNFTKFTGKQLRWGLCLNKVAGLRIFLYNIFFYKTTPVAAFGKCLDEGGHTGALRTERLIT